MVLSPRATRKKKEEEKRKRTEKQKGNWMWSVDRWLSTKQTRPHPYSTVELTGGGDLMTGGILCTVVQHCRMTRAGGDGVCQRGRMRRCFFFEKPRDCV